MGFPPFGVRPTCLLLLTTEGRAEQIDQSVTDQVSARERKKEGKVKKKSNK